MGHCSGFPVRRWRQQRHSGWAVNIRDDADAGINKTSEKPATLSRPRSRACSVAGDRKKTLSRPQSVDRRAARRGDPI